MSEHTPVVPSAVARLTPHAEPEHWYRSLYLHSLDGILLTTPEGEILAANPAMCRMLGYEEAELCALGRAGVVDTTDPRLAPALEQRRATGAFAGELTLLAKGGRRVPVEVSTRVYRDATGAERTSLYVRDITERKRADEQLRWSEERFRVALKSSPIVMYTADADLRYTWMYNPHPRFRVEEVIGKRDEELVPEEHVAELIALKREVVATGRGVRRELRIIVGEEARFYDVTVEPTRDADGTVTGLTMAATDITERWHREQERLALLEIATQARKEAEQEKERVALLAAVTESLTEMLEYERSLGSVARLLVHQLATLCLVDVVEEGGEVRRVEAVHADATQQSLADALRAISLGRGQPHLSRRALETGEAEMVEHVTDDDLRVVAQDEHHLDVLRALRVRSCLGLPLVARDRTLGAITLIRDGSREPFSAADLALGKEIARRAALAIDNAHLFRQARRATELRDRVMSIVSHDLRTPLTSISMALAPFELGEPGPDTLSRLVRVARQSIELMERMIHDLLDVASIDRGTLSIERGPEDLESLLSRACATVSAQLAEDGIAITLDVPPGLPRADADAERILQVVGNLLSNAGKFAARGGHVSLAARAAGEELVVSVRDDGPGIPANMQPHIFDRFWHSRRGARARGIGLGLSIAKAIVDAHGGRIWVDSVEGEGSTFSFTLPVFHRRAGGEGGVAGDEPGAASQS
jgi:PAS domain S-box-containing protein